MTVALLSIGTELTRGEILNTNANWLAAELTATGFNVAVAESTPDSTESIAQAVRRLASISRLVIATGGLGPTTDDLTATAAACAAGVDLVRDESALLVIRRRVEALGKTMNPGLEKQADIPAGCEMLSNSVGVAPGFSLQLGETTVFFLPGVPREMKRMFVEQVLPRVRPTAPNNSFQVRLRTYGLGESAIGQALEGIEAAHNGVTLGYRVNFPEVDVKVHSRAASQSQARTIALQAAADVKQRLGSVLYGEGDETFPEIVARAVRSRGWRLAVSESFTGGLMAYLLTNQSDNDYFVGGAVAYANSAKTRLLSVAEDTIRGHGVVSGEVAAEMAESVRRLCECDVGVAVAGVSGPAATATANTPGLVYSAVAHPGGTVVREHSLTGDREELRLLAAYSALDLLRKIASGADR